MHINNSSSINRTGFLDLNADCLYIIFEYLYMTDLFSMADTKEDLSFIIEVNLKRRFAKKHNSLKLPNNHDETAALIVKTLIFQTL